MNSKSKKVDKTVNHQNNRNGYSFTSFSKLNSSKKEFKDNTPKLPKSRPVSKSIAD